MEPTPPADPVERGRELNAAIQAETGRHQREMAFLGRARADVIRQLLATGLTKAQVAELLGMHVSRPGQILRDHPAHTNTVA